MTYQLRPSASGIWTKCAANPRMTANLKREPVESDAAREGTCAAWVADCVLKGDAHSCEDMLGETHKNGWVVTDDMVYYVQGYVDMVRSRGGSVSAEQTVRLTDQIAGTFDSSVVSFDGTTLYVDDLKYGYKIVDVYENTQTIIYGAAEYMRLNNPAIQEVVLGIYQPRAWHPEGIHRTWRMTVAELFEHANKIAEAGQRAQVPNANATPGSHCEHCKASGECVALAHTLYSWHNIIEDSRQGSMTADQLAAELDFLDKLGDLIKARKTAIDAEAQERIGKGEFVRGWGMKERRGHRKFNVPAPVIEAMTGISPYKKEELSPPELERAGASKDIVDKLSSRPIIGYKLDRVTDKDIGRMFRDR